MSSSSTTTPPFPERAPRKQAGTDRTLIDWGEMLEGFEQLARNSSRLRIESLGAATEGGEMVLLLLSSAGTIARIDSLRKQRRALVDDDALLDSENAHGQLAGDKTVVLLTAGIHADEVGGVQVMPELVEELSSSDDPAIASMLDNVLLLIVPTLNPDGMDMMHRWYRDTLGTPYEGTELPGLYHRYAGHDNNRDWYTHALAETQLVVQRVHNVWRPHLVLDLHQMRETAPRYVVPPYIDPAEPHVHPRINALSSAVGAHAAAALVREGRAGSSSGVMFDCYSPTRAYQHYHGGVRILAEAASARIATPIDIASDAVKPQRGFDPAITSVHCPVPWSGGTWRLRDIMDYHLTTIRAVLEHAAVFRVQWLRDQWAMLADQCREAHPDVFVVAPLRHQVDPPAARALIELIMNGDVRVEVVTGASSNLPDGAFLVRTNQPCGSYARALLELTPYPMPSDPEIASRSVPYDVTSHCLPIHMGVDVRPGVSDAQVSSRPVEPDDLRPFAPIRASDVDRNRWLALDPRSHAVGGAIAHALRNGSVVHRLMRPHLESGRLLPAGTWLISDDSAFAAASDARERALRSWLVRPVTAGIARQHMPRVGVHVPWRSNATDAGWLQLTLDALGMPYTALRDADIRAGATNDIDVLVLPHLPPRDLLEGNTADAYPAAYCGGLGAEGVTMLHEFMKRGGHVVAIDGSAQALIEALNLPVRRPLSRVKPAQFSSPGAMVRVVPELQHPLALGVDEPFAAFFGNSVAFSPRPDPSVSIAASFAEHDLVASGWVHGPQHLAGNAAVVEIAIGEGRFVGFGFRPHFRAQMLASYPMLINALLRPGLDALTRPGSTLQGGRR